MSKSKIVGWALSGLLGAFLILASASGKFTEWEGKSEMFAKMGWSESVMVKIGVVEVISALLFLVPASAFVGAILLTAYLGGAVSTHVRVDDPFVIPIVMGVLVWVALGLRDCRVFALAMGRPPRESNPKA